MEAPIPASNIDNFRFILETINDKISLKIINEITKIEYKGEFSKQSFIEKNHVFSTFTPDNIINALQSTIINKKVRIIEENQRIKSFWKFIVLVDEIEIELICKKISEKEEMKEIKNRLIFFETQNRQLIEKNNELTSKVNELERKVNELSNLIISSDLPRLRSGRINSSEETFCGFTKKILRNLNEAQIIIGWILPHKNWIVRLLYDAGRDGDRYFDLRAKCMNKGAWLFLGETTEGRRFGGYSTVNLVKQQGQGGQYYADEKSFLFSLDKGKKYVPVLSNAVVDNYHYPIYFGQIPDLCIKDHFLTGFHVENSGDEECAYNTSRAGDLTGKNKFKLKSFEIYQVLEN